MRIGLFHTTIREDEKLIIHAAKEKGVDLVVVDARTQIYNPATWSQKFDVVLERCISTTVGMHVLSFFQSIGIPTVNRLEVAQVCEDKFATSLALTQHNVPTIPFALVFTEIQAKEAIESLGGYPVVLKSTSGSWGRLGAKINDADALEGVIEQKSVLGTPPHKAFYLQKFIEKPGRDIRVTMTGNNVLCAIYRETEHWVTNTARGAEARNCPIDEDLRKISLAASHAVGGGILGVDVFETDHGYVINEVNHTTEFKNVQRVTGVDVGGAMLAYCMEVAKHAAH